MYRVPQYLGFALHALLLPSLQPLIAAPLFDSVHYTSSLTINQVNILFIIYTGLPRRSGRVVEEFAREFHLTTNGIRAHFA
jgi:hypothetical protein